VHEERENCEAGVLLGGFWCKAISRTQFALLLFLRSQYCLKYQMYVARTRHLAKVSVSRKLKVKTLVVIKFGKYYKLQD